MASWDREGAAGAVGSSCGYVAAEGWSGVLAARSHDYNIFGQLPFLVSAAFWTLPSEEGALSGALEAVVGRLLGQAERMGLVADRVIWAR